MDCNMYRASVTLFLVGLFALSIFYYNKKLIKRIYRFLPHKYREETNFTTTTRHYSFDDGDNLEETYVPCTQNCSWESTLSNEEFTKKVNFTRPFDIDDDLSLFSQKSHLACVPFSFGFSREKGLDVFPPFSYPDCASKLSQPIANLTLNTKADTITLTCPPEKDGKYLLFPESLSRTGQYLYTDIPWKMQKYPRHTVSAENSEFAFAGCEEELTVAAHVPKFQSKVFTRTQEKMEKAGFSASSRPMVVLFLALDSFSRRHFYRKLPKTVDLLNRFNAGKEFAVFDFKLHNIMGQGSAENMVPVFTNQTFKDYGKVPKGDVLGKTALWNMFREFGYTTLVGFEDCDYHFPYYLGSELNVDHMVRSFYCAAFKYLGLRMWSWIKEQRCVGAHMSHYYILNYTQEFTRMYQGNNQFIYLHLDAAHEESGQHAATLDPDLSAFLEKFISDFSAQNDLAIFLQADHGMRYGSWYKDIEAHQESKLPALFFLTQRSLLDRLPGSYDTLWHNSQRLVSQKDLRATLLALAEIPYGRRYPVHEYEPYLSDSSILFLEKVRDSRTCASQSIPPWCCSCLPTTRVAPELLHSWDRSDLERVLKLTVYEALRIMNSQVTTPSNAPVTLICQPLSFDYIAKAYGSTVGTKTEELQVEFHVKESLTARFEVFAILGSDDSHELMDTSRERHNFVPSVYQDVKVRVRVIDIVRKDRYKGPCEVVSRRNGLKAEYCLCNDLEELEKTRPGLFGSR